MIDAILAKVFGTKNKREIKAIQPIIAAINNLAPAIQQLSDIDLAAKTIEFKEKLAQGAPLDDLLIEAFQGELDAAFEPVRPRMTTFSCGRAFEDHVRERVFEPLHRGESPALRGWAFAGIPRSGTHRTWGNAELDP